MGRITSLTNELLNAIENLNDAYEDIQMWGAPSECMSDVDKYFQKEVYEIFNSYCMTKDQYEEELSHRVSDNWIHKNLGQIF